MRLRTNIGKYPPGEKSVALVITLLMLSVITFLAIAFLAMTKRNQSAVTATLDVDTARSMSEAALARAQAEVVAGMMAQTDILAYGYMASHNYITPSYIWSNNDPNVSNINNVNYDAFWGEFGTNLGVFDEQAWAQNIANLFYDPRPPVFVLTNGNLRVPQYDFRYWVDINRNGKFESNGYVRTLDSNNLLTGFTNYFDGEPEWIGVLKYPAYVHSPTNPFIGRYAYMVLPIGKTLDFNYIYNYSKFAAGDAGRKNMPQLNQDAYIRDQGVGSWELNLAALLYNVSSTMYEDYVGNNPTYYQNYVYNVPAAAGANRGAAFDDAAQFLAFRYGHNGAYPYSFSNTLGSILPAGILDIDQYGVEADTAALDYYGTPANQPTAGSWPGAYSSNAFYDVQDLFDTNRTGLSFPTNLLNTVSSNDSYDRYTFQRILDCIGMGSQPEYGTYVYSNLPVTSNVTLLADVPRPSLLRTKVNINFDNSAQIQAGPYDSSGRYTPMPTNLQAWGSPLEFFTNAADLLLRSQVFAFTNYATNAFGQFLYYTNGSLNGMVPFAAPSNFVYATFGITNIPVYIATNPGVCYNEQVHRMLQLAANIYAATYPVYGLNGFQIPPVFRPEFQVTSANGTNVSIYITNFVPVSGRSAYLNILKGFRDISTPTNSTNTVITRDDNVWGVPWVIGAVKGLPAFDQYSYNNQIYIARLLNFLRHPSSTPGPYDNTRPPQYTNQYFEMSISNICGMDAWNPYQTPFSGSGSGLCVMAANIITVTVTNNSTNGFPYSFSYSYSTNGILSHFNPNQFMTFLQNTNIVLPLSYFSESNQVFSPLTSPTSGFLGGDSVQMNWPTHYWAVAVTNHMYYALFDGNPTNNPNANLLDFVNLGPFGSYFPIIDYLAPPNMTNTYWSVYPATDAGSGLISDGVQNQINFYKNGNSTNLQFYFSLLGNPQGYPATKGSFGPPVPAPGFGQQAPSVLPYTNYTDSNIWMACDPLVHYTLGDLYSPSYQNPSHTNLPVYSPQLPLTLGTGTYTGRYLAGTHNGNLEFGDPGMVNSDAWQFPTNLFPSVGWLGRVHRGTPWQTIYLKSDDLSGTSYVNWTNTWVNSIYTYPTNDWSLVDLFTAVPNDNAARGLLSVNQTNDAAWAAVFGGVIVSNLALNTGIPLNPTSDIANMLDSPNFGINAVRSTNFNGLFHHIGDILQSPALTFAATNVTNIPAANLNDEMVERIPQQTLGLMKLGLPQFVIYSWGQSLRPKDLYTGPGPSYLMNLCTNYEITGEYLTRTVCHIVGDPGAGAPKIVIDNYNIVPSE